MNLLAATKDNLQAIAKYMTEKNANPLTRCTYLGDDFTENLEYLVELSEQETPSIFFLEKESKVIGAIAGDLCEDNERIEVLGPFIEEDLGDALTTVEKMINQIKTIKPEYHLSFFLDAQNQFMAQCILKCNGKSGAINYNMNYDLTLKTPESNPLVTQSCIEYTNTDQQMDKIKTQIVKLHNETFPNTYYNGETIFKLLDNQHFLSYCLEGETVTSYVFYNSEEDGYLDYLGTNENYRKKGYATTLLKHMMERLKQQKCNNVTLCVIENDDDAIRLYKKLGFVTTDANRGYSI